MLPCRVALAQQDHRSLAELMDSNFDLRRSMFGDAALGMTNLKMIDMARSIGGESLWNPDLLLPRPCSMVQQQMQTC